VWTHTTYPWAISCNSGRSGNQCFRPRSWVLLIYMKSWRKSRTSLEEPFGANSWGFDHLENIVCRLSINIVTSYPWLFSFGASYSSQRLNL